MTKTTMKIDPKRDAELRQLANRIMLALMTTYRTNERATRLALMQKQKDDSGVILSLGVGNEKYLGGLCEQAIVDHILAHLRRAEIAGTRKKRKP